MASSLQSTQVETKMTILLPFIPEDYHSFKMFDVLRLNKMSPHFDNYGINVDLINPNEDYNPIINNEIELIIRLTEKFSDKQKLLKRHLIETENLHVDQTLQD